MADVMKTKTQLENFFQAAITRILGHDPEVKHDRVRISWATRGQPGWKITDNVAFIQVTPVPNPAIHQQDTTLIAIDSQTLLSQKTYMREISVNFICYGPNAWEDTESIWHGFLSETTRQEMERNNLGYIDREGPFRAPEPFNGQWWERADLTLRFYEGVKKEAVIGTIETVVVGGNATVGNNDGASNDPVQVIIKEG